MSRGAMKIGILFVLIVFASLYLVSLLGDGITGFAVLETGAIISSTSTLEEQVIVSSMRVTGSFSGNGNATLYLGDKIVLDSRLLNATSFESYCAETCVDVDSNVSLHAILEGDALLIITAFNYTSDEVVTIDPIENETEQTNQTFNQTDGEQMPEPVALSEDVGIEAVFNTSNSTQFDSGRYNRTEFNTSGFVQLNASDYLQELPNNQSTEYYLDRIINMSGNVLLFHFNNDSTGLSKENNTHLYDWSRSGNNGTWLGGGLSNTPSKLGTFSGNFSGGNDNVSVVDSASLDITSAITVSAWVKFSTITTQYPTIVSKNPVNGAYLLFKSDDAASSGFAFRVKNVTGHTTAYGNQTLVAGLWYHVVGTYDSTTSTNNLRLYVNGALGGQASKTGAIATTAENLFIGDFDGDSGQFNGSIDEVAIWNRSLSFEEVQTIYGRQKGQFIDRGQYESQVFDAGETQNWTNISWKTEFQYGLDLPNFGANETENFVRGMNMSGNVLLFHFNNDTVKENKTQTGVYDWSGNNNNGTTIGALFNTSGKLSGSMDFDGINDYVALSEPPAGSTNLTTGSVFAWIKTRQGPYYHGIVVKASAYGMFVKDGVFLLYDWRADADRDSAVFVADDLWHHVGFTFINGSTGGTKLYVDGVLRLTTILNISSHGDGIAIGAGGNPPTSQYFNGSMDEVA
ncbi:MAG TPA: LamG domain-containing protein, partial [Candidatus Nanoarchaeia archaeon]|nr:LamG domain-containing protein [Candidatus Nanoarchaeia archaeon]